MTLTRSCLLFLCYVSLLAETSAQNNPADIPYDDCGGSDHQQLASIRLTGCEEDEICEITMEDVLTLKVNWKTYQPEVVTLKSKLQLQFLFGFKRDVHIVPLDACSYLKCPLMKDTDIHYIANFTVPGYGDIFPGEGRIWWNGYDQSLEEPLLCVNFRVTILSNKN